MKVSAHQPNTLTPHLPPRRKRPALLFVLFAMAATGTIPASADSRSVDSSPSVPAEDAVAASVDGHGGFSSTAVDRPGYLDARGDQVRAWCDTYQGRSDTDKWCTGVVNWCWDVCIVPDGSKKYFEGPYGCGPCFGISF